MVFHNKNSDLESLIANTSLEEIIRIKEEAIIKQQSELEAELKKLRSLVTEKPQQPTGQKKTGTFNNILTKSSNAGTVSEKVLKVFRDLAGAGVTNEEISDKTGLDIKVVRDCVSKMTKSGKLRAEKKDNSLIKTYYFV